MPALVRKTPQEEGSLPKTYDDDKQPVFSVEQMGLHCLRHSEQASAKSHCSWPLSALKRSRDMLRRQIEQECNALEINRIAVSSSADTSDGAGASRTYHHLNLGTAYRTGLVCREFNFFIAREIKNDVKDEAVAAKSWRTQWMNQPTSQWSQV
jgi:hypothetical protein